MKSSDMPSPDTVIEYPDGHTGMAMFFYGMPEDTDARIVAEENGFHAKLLSLECDNSHAAIELLDEYKNGEEPADIFRRWNPYIPEGWALCEKYETDDGIVAMVIKPIYDEAHEND